MSLNNSSARVRPYPGRDEAFAVAMARAERRAEQQAAGVPLKAKRSGDSVGITRDGWVVLANGSRFYPDDLPPERFAHLPIID